jgi:hypothetical protein
MMPWEVGPREDKGCAKKKKKKEAAEKVHKKKRKKKQRMAFSDSIRTVIQSISDPRDPAVQVLRFLGVQVSRCPEEGVEKHQCGGEVRGKRKLKEKKRGFFSLCAGKPLLSDQGCDRRSAAVPSSKRPGAQASKRRCWCSK